jgi:glycosyltransferase involved in cell wall biosynthesis
LRALADGYAVFFSPDGDPGQVAEMIAQTLSADRLYAFRARVRMHFTWERIYRQQIQPVLKT